MKNNNSYRSTIILEDGEILFHEAYPAAQYILRVTAPRIAALATPGSFAHLQCAPELPMRRPLSIMRIDPRQGRVEFLYKVVGQGTRLLAQRRPGESLSILGPIGQPFQLNPTYPRPLLLGGGVGIPPMVFLADILRQRPHFKPLVLMGSEVPFPFRPRPSQFLIPALPKGVIGAMPLLEDWKIPSRLASLKGYPGCFEGFITDLARHWLQALPLAQQQEVALYACGPHPMLAATAQLAREFDRPCQVSLEEFMACAVGGCAGCTVEIQTEHGSTMKRVCVDGPVFDARAVFA